MFKYFFSKAIIYVIVLVFIVPVIILFLMGNASRKQTQTEVEATPVVSPAGSPVTGVPLPTKEDMVRTFCTLIAEGRISEAVEMMDIQDESTKQAWGVSLNNFSAFMLVKIKPSSIDETENSFEVDINVTLKKNLTNLPIPNYGWENGVNKKWINLVEKSGGLYKIAGIATGP